MSRQSLELRVGQQLTLTPSLQQSIRLLQLSTLDLEAEIAQALSDNPLLEVVADASDTDAATPDIQALEAQPDRYENMAYSASSGAHHGRDDEQHERPESARQVTFREHLLLQLAVTHVSERDAALIMLLIDDLNDDGLLESSLTDILAMLNPTSAVVLEELQTALRLLQSFDPVGVGGRDLAECLSLQLHQPDLAVLPMLSDPGVLLVARRVCQSHLDLLAAGNLSRLCELLDTPMSVLQQACAGIRRLSPRPASPWSRPAAAYALPDVIARKTRAGWQIELNEAVVPKIRVNEIYAQALGSSKNVTHAALYGQLQEARSLIRQVHQRFETVLRVSQAIAAHQYAFFETGWGGVRPLVLRDIATELGLHESTVSRATTQKFMLTPFGVVELKRFFGSGLVTEGGESTSSTAVQTKIRELIHAENPIKPLSDAQLVKMLEAQGITVARRTVAKYREHMRILSATQRKAQAVLSSSPRSA